MLFLLFYTILLLSAKGTFTADLNVGTVLFTKADLYKECWSSDNVAMLTSRMILEDLLPSTSILVIDSNEFITDLVEYFRLILETVRKETQGKIKHLTLMALTDLLGGYLHHAVLPIAKYAYYAGSIDYDSMATLLGLFDELKWFLRTNGQGWAKPSHQTFENFEIQKIPLQPCNDNNVCDNLILVEGEKGNGAKSSRNDITIPLPFFDSITQPHAVALPTKVGPLYSVEANSSSFLLMNFFVTASKCLQVKNAPTENVQKFEHDFDSWIEDQILPRLEDERFYSAFGGILRVRNTIKRLGVTEDDVNKQLGDLQNVNSNKNGQQKNTEVVIKPGPQAPQQMSKSSMILTAALITIFIWFLLGTLFICFKIRQSRMKEDSDEEDSEKTGTSITSSKACIKDKSTGKCKGTRADITNTPSQLDLVSYKKRGYRHQITIKTCSCDDREGGSPSSRSSTRSTTVTDTNPTNTTTNSRLPSITEISEDPTPASTSVRRDSKAEEKKNEVPQPPATSTPAEDDDAARRISSIRLLEPEDESTESDEEESSPE